VIDARTLRDGGTGAWGGGSVYVPGFGSICKNGLTSLFGAST
jgi:hypothetical protein